jgi:hypothetical protein
MTIICYLRSMGAYPIRALPTHQYSSIDKEEAL